MAGCANSKKTSTSSSSRNPNTPRLVDTAAIVEAGLTLLHEAEIVPAASPYRSITSRSREARRRTGGAADRVALTRAVLARNGLMIALLALCPTRLKNFAGLEIGTSVVKLGSSWWLVIEPDETKQGRPEERAVPDLLAPHLDRYITHHRPVLCRGRRVADAGLLWISAESGDAMPYDGVEVAIRRTSEAALGVAIGPHNVPHQRRDDSRGARASAPGSRERPPAARGSTRDGAAPQQG